MERTTASLGNYLWLGQRLEAKTNPITHKQLERFGKHPHGSVPDLCVEVKRLPDSYGRISNNESRRPISELTVTPNGKPCLVTLIDENTSVVCGDEVYRLTPDNSTNCPWIQNITRLLGFASDGKPVTYIDGRRIIEPGTQPIITRDRIFHGSKLILSSAKEMHGATLLVNGDVVYSSQADDKTMQLLRNTEEIKRSFGWNHPSRFFEGPDGIIICLYKHHRTEDSFHVGPFKTICEIPLWNSFVHLRLTSKGLFGITKNCVVNQLLPFTSEEHMFLCSEDLMKFGNNHYISGFTELPDGRIVYVGESTRDHLQCMVVGGEEQASFDKVSPLFEHDGVWMYYGLIGWHLYTMEIPKPK